MKTKSAQLAIEGGTPVRPDYLIFGAPLIEDEEIQEVVETLKSGWLSTGPRVKRFEQDFKEYIGAEHCIAVSSCTAAMHLSLVANEIGPGDEVIVPAMTFAATANVVEHVGATPIFVDSEADSFNIDPQQAREAVTPRTKAIMPVHFAGLPCDMNEIGALAAQNGLTIIEDAAHAVGSEYSGEKIGNLGNCTAFSFYVTKNLCTAEGGMITTPDDALADKMRVLSLHGMDLGAWQRYEKGGNKHYEVVYPGFKYNMTDISAALGLQQLRKLDRFIDIRQRYASVYHEEFQKLEELILPPDDDLHRNAWHLYPIMVRPETLTTDRDGIQEAVGAENVGTGIHFRPVHQHPYYRQKYEYAEGSLPRSEFIGERVFSLPLSPLMTEDDVQFVITAVKKVISHYRK